MIDRARGLILAAWRPRGVAWNEWGAPVAARHPDAVEHSAFGALIAASEIEQEADAARQAVQRELNAGRPPEEYEALPRWEDRRDRAKHEVLAVFDAAIARLKGR